MSSEKIGKISMIEGWEASCTSTELYKFGIQKGSRLGENAKCAFIECQLANEEDFGLIGQAIRSDEYREKRVRYSGSLRTIGVENWVGLWMRVDGINGLICSFDNMNNRPVVGTTQWRNYEIVLDVTEHSSIIAFGVILTGAGKVWINNLKIEPVGIDVPITARRLKPLWSKQPQNVDFKIVDSEQDGFGWFFWSDCDDKYEFRIERKRRTNIGVLHSRKSENGKFIGLTQKLDSLEFEGKRVRLAAEFKAKDVKGNFGLFMNVFGIDGRIFANEFIEDQSSNRHSHWFKQEIVLYVPTYADGFNFGIRLCGSGTIEFKNIELETVSDNVPVTKELEIIPMVSVSLGYLPNHPINLNFGI